MKEDAISYQLSAISYKLSAQIFFRKDDCITSADSSLACILHTVTIPRFFLWADS